MTTTHSQPTIYHAGVPAEATVIAACPYCGHEQDIVIDLHCHDPQVRQCNPDKGGCVKWFVVRIEILATTDSRTIGSG